MSSSTLVRYSGTDKAPPVQAPPSAVGATDSFAPSKSRGWWTFGAFFAGYLAVGTALISSGVVFPDAVSRTANAYYVLFSRFPHLPAVGFVWNPLPSLVQLPLISIKAVAPGLVTHGVAALIQSAGCMAATMVVIGSCLRKLRVGRLPRAILVALCGLQPMTLLYAGSGLSEPMLLLFLTLAASALISWVRSDHVGSLVGAGVALGGAYLTRYEAVAPGIAVLVGVGVIAGCRASGTARDRLRAAVLDAVIVAAPQAFVLLVWAASARILVGQWFPTFGSAYGNSAQVNGVASAITAATGSGFIDTIWYTVRQIGVLAPACLPLVALAVILAGLRRDVAALVPMAVFGSVLGFFAVVLLAGSSFGWLRFQIAAIPLTVLSAGVLLSRRRSRRAAENGPGRGWIAVVLVAVAAAVPIQSLALTTPGWNLAREEAPLLAAAVRPGVPGAAPQLLDPYRTDRQISADIDRMELPAGSVLTDSAYSFSVVTSSARPRTFVITSDLDFTAAVRDPRAAHIQYMLVRSEAKADAVQAAWPGLFENGSGIGTLVRNWDGAFGRWRLYRVT